jgi:tRNA1(Val) A37 N6-methylase TrmN6
MTKLWYDYDEVTQFHPIVEEVLNNSLENCGYSEIAEILHHPTIPNSTIVPDFAIKLKSSNRFIFVLEVKKTNRDCYSQRFQNQTRSYVTDLIPFWEPNYEKYFCLTNVETLSFFAEREGAVTSCLLKNYPVVHTAINPNNHDATTTIQEFQVSIENILNTIFRRTIPSWSNNWEPIIESFYQNYISIKENLDYEEETAKDTTLYELFRLIAFSYLKEYYALNDNSKSTYFRGRFPTEEDNLIIFKQKLENSFTRILQLDFRQIFSNYPNDNFRIFPDNISETLTPYFKNLILNLINYSSNAVADNSSPEYIFNLLSSKIYDKETMHNKGQVMSDSELSILLATLTIDSHNLLVLDPCCGDGALLDASYDCLNSLSLDNGIFKTHNELLSQNIGIELDSFLAQLSTFRLLTKNLFSITNDTEANIIINDTFTTNLDNQVDIILMNPPFLRNDNRTVSITEDDKTRMIEAINSTDIECFVTQASQPNLYYYFINYVWKYLNNNGKAGFIIMAKFLNNIDGEALKEFMLDKVEAIILYPNNYFKDFSVTTVITILSKQPSEHIKFLRILDENMLANPNRIKTILEENNTVVTADYSLKICNRDILSSSNWKLHLIDPEDKFNILDNLDFFENIENFFDIGRGKAGNTGGSTIVFPNIEDEPYNLIDTQYISYGIKNNKARRSLIFTEEDLNIEQAIYFSYPYDETIANGLNVNYADEGLNTLFDNTPHTPIKWKKIVNTSFNSKVNFNILIPRADRTKHICYYNPFNNNIVLSTNFWYLNNVHNLNLNVDIDLQIKFVSAFLISSFGQIQFEIHSNNQEGMRKIEGFHIQQFKIIDPKIVSNEEIEHVVNQFENLNLNTSIFSGLEGLNNNPRRDLDTAIGEIIFTRDTLGFQNTNNLVDFFELFLLDLVEDRKL